MCSTAQKYRPIAFERNRRALLRMVCIWLQVAKLVARIRGTLPRRLSRFVHLTLVKAEAAAGYLLIVHARNCSKAAIIPRALREACASHRTGRLNVVDLGGITLKEVINRLYMLRAALRAVSMTSNRNGARGVGPLPKRFLASRDSLHLCATSTLKPTFVAQPP